MTDSLRASVQLPGETPGAWRPLQQLLLDKATAAGSPTTLGQSRQAPGTGIFLLQAPDTREMLVTAGKPSLRREDLSHPITFVPTSGCPASLLPT